MIVDFYRQNYSDVFLRVLSNESLGILYTERIEDDNGVDGQVTLEHEDGSRVTMVMVEDSGQTPAVDNDVLIGQVSLSSMLDGVYTFLGRVIDSIGNERFMVNSATPAQNEVLFQLRILTGVPVFPSITSGKVIEAIGIIGAGGSGPVLLSKIERSKDNLVIERDALPTLLG